VTAGFWSKDEILADAWGHGQVVVFGTLALAALLTAFYTMRQITLTFLGKPRTEAAHHAHETPWTMTLPLAILAIFSIVAGWVGIPEHFPVIGGLLPNWFHEFLGGTLLEHPEAIEFNLVPLLTSLVVALGGLYMGWLVYRETPADAQDPIEVTSPSIHRLLQNKYYFDEIYDRIFVRPAYWFSETFTSAWMDRGVIDGVLHWVAMVSGMIGGTLREYIDKRVVNASGDMVGEGVKKFGRTFRAIQTGRVQQYMIGALVTLAFFSALFYYLVFTP